VRQEAEPKKIEKKWNTTKLFTQQNDLISWINNIRIENHFNLLITITIKDTLRIILEPPAEVE